MVFDPFNENRFIVCTTSGFYVGMIENGSITMSTKLLLGNNCYDCAVAFDPWFKDCIYGVFNYGYSSVYVSYGKLITFGGVVTYKGLSTYTITAKVPEYLQIAVNPFTYGHIVIAYRDQSNGYGMYKDMYFINETNSWNQGTLNTFSTTGVKYISLGFDPHINGIMYLTYVDTVAGALRVKSSYPGYGVTSGYINIEPASVSYANVAPNPNIQGDYLAICTYAGGTVLKPFHISPLTNIVTQGTRSDYSALPWTPGNFVYYKICFDSSNPQSFVFLYKNTSTNRLIIQEGSTDGSTVTLGTAYTIGGVGDEYTSMVENPNIPGQFVVAYCTYANHYPNICLIQRNSSNLNKKTLVGVITEAGNSDQSKAVSLLGGVISDLSGLTVNADYYVQPDGTISTTNSPCSVYIGRAISTTAIQTKKP